MVGTPTSVWPDGKATIVLLPSGEQGAAIQELAKNWAEVGLLSPALWLRPEDVQMSEHAPPEVTATVIGLLPDQSVSEVRVPLFEQLARETLRTVRLVKVRSATPSRELDEEQDAVVACIDEYLSWAMPAPNKSQSDIDEEESLEILTLVASPTQFSASRRLSAKQRGQGTTVIASPEDRSTPWAIDAFVRERDRFEGFVLMHIATLGGLWNGLPVGTFELLESARPNGQGVWVSRVFFSGVLTDGLARRVAAEVIRDAANPAFVLESPPEGAAYIEDQVQDEYVDWLVDQIMYVENGMLMYQRLEDAEGPSQRDRGILAQLGAFFGFAGQKFIQMPRWTWRWIVGKISRKVQASLHGEDGVETVNLPLQREQLDNRDRILLDRYAETLEVVAQSRVELAAPVALAQTRSTPELWRAMRRWIFGSLDGGTGSDEYCFPPVDGRRVMFRNVESVLPAQTLKWEFPKDIVLPNGVPQELDWINLEAAFAAEPALASWVEESAKEVQLAKLANFDASAEVAHLEQRMQALDEEIRARGGFEVAPDGSETPKTLAQVTADHTVVLAPRSKSTVVEASASEAEAPDKAIEPEAEVEIDAVEESDVSELPETESEVEPEAELEAELETVSEAEETSEAAVEPEPEPEPEAPATQVDPAADELKALLRERRALIKEHKAAVRQMEDAQTASLAASNEHVARAEVRIGFEGWRHGVERSLTWKLRERLSSEQTQVENDIAQLLAETENLNLPNPGRLITARRKFHRRLLVAWPLTALITGSVALISQTEAAKRLLAEQQLNAEAIPLIATGIGLLVMTIIYFGVTAAYHREWSRWEFAIERDYARLSAVSGRFANAKQEQARLRVLHRQALDWMGLLGQALSQPWAARPSWLQSLLRTLQTDRMPFAMRVAQANDNDHASRSILRSRAENALSRVGWREQAFERMVAEVARAAGKSPDACNVSALDADLPHASNGTRDLVRRFISDETLLENVAVSYLRPIIRDLQANAMATARPTVLQVIDDPLDSLRADGEGIDGVMREHRWDDFLQISLARGTGQRESVPPISKWAVAEAKISSGHHENVQAFAIMPGRLTDQLSDNTLAELTVRSFDAETVRPIDAVVRIDLVGPLSDGDVKVWEGTPEPNIVSRQVIESATANW